MPLTDSQAFDQQQSRIAGRDSLLAAQAKMRVADVLDGPIAPTKLFAAYGKGAAVQLARFSAAVELANLYEPKAVDKTTLPKFTANDDGTVTVG